MRSSRCLADAERWFCLGEACPCSGAPRAGRRWRTWRGGPPRPSPAQRAPPRSAPAPKRRRGVVQRGVRGDPSVLEECVLLMAGIERRDWRHKEQQGRRESAPAAARDPALRPCLESAPSGHGHPPPAAVGGGRQITCTARTVSWDSPRLMSLREMSRAVDKRTIPCATRSSEPLTGLYNEGRAPQPGGPPCSWCVARRAC